jgi:hypothetical protein
MLNGKLATTLSSFNQHEAKFTKNLYNLMLFKLLHIKLYKENIKVQHSIFPTKKNRKKKLCLQKM